MQGVTLARFWSDITPPLGHPLCGGLVRSAESIDDALTARGIVILGIDEPIVLCALDWCSVRNEAHDVWRQQLAQAAGTRPGNVAVHCVHQHNAPIADFGAERYLLSRGETSAHIIDSTFFHKAVERASEELRRSLKHQARITHIGTGQACVERVASNRRILDAAGKVQLMRYSATRNIVASAAPEGAIDPWLKTLSFWDESRPLAALHYYATHPMSYYDDGRVSSDFVGWARASWERQNPGTLQIYFTGSAGDVAAGKYNDGAPERRHELARRVLRGMQAAWTATQRSPIDGCNWRTLPVRLPGRQEYTFGAARSLETLGAAARCTRDRINAALRLSWLDREHKDLELSCLDLGRALIVHLPGEPFVFYQIKTQELCPQSFVCVAGYGDGGPGYIPTDRAYLEGGYEPTTAMVGHGSEALLVHSLAKLLRG